MSKDRRVGEVELGRVTIRPSSFTEEGGAKLNLLVDPQDAAAAAELMLLMKAKIIYKVSFTPVEVNGEPAL